MGFFSEIIDAYKCSDAAYEIEKAFQKQSELGHLNGVDIYELSMKLCRNVSELQPDIFRGKKGTRPHKLVYALCALVMGLELFEKESAIYLGILLAFNRIQMDVINNGSRYSFSQLDLQLIENSIKATTYLAVNGAAILNDEEI